MTITNEKLLAQWIVSAPGAACIAAENGPAEEAMLRTLGLTRGSVQGCLLRDLGYVLGSSRRIRILGGKNNQCRSCFELNQLEKGYTVLKNLLLVGDLAGGGLFGLYGARDRAADPGEVLYLPPDGLTWERLGIGYTDFVRWATFISKEDLAAGGWIPPGTGELLPRKADAIAQGKIDLLLSLEEKEDVQ